MDDFTNIRPGSWVEIPEGYEIMIRDIDDIVREAAQYIVRDLRDRSGIGGAFDACDRGIMSEIVEEIAGRIRKASHDISMYGAARVGFMSRVEAGWRVTNDIDDDFCVTFRDGGAA
ncbi:hypothetical protein GOL99_12195 [Sinorhizobium medicae]|nr:hypothetical protein [Sinorhizobium medicae]